MRISKMYFWTTQQWILFKVFFSTHWMNPYVCVVEFNKCRWALLFLRNIQPSSNLHYHRKSRHFLQTKYKQIASALLSHWMRMLSSFQQCFQNYNSIFVFWSWNKLLSTLFDLSIKKRTTNSKIYVIWNGCQLLLLTIS